MTPQKEAATAKEPFHSPEVIATPMCKEPGKNKSPESKRWGGKGQGRGEGKMEMERKVTVAKWQFWSVTGGESSTQPQLQSSAPWGQDENCRSSRGWMLQPVRALQGMNQVFMKYHEAQVFLLLRGYNIERYQKELMTWDFFIQQCQVAAQED